MIRIKGREEIEELGLEAVISKRGEYSMRGQTLITVIDPSEPPGWSRLVESFWTPNANVEEN